MAIQLTDAEITSILSEPKALPSDYQSRLQLRAKTSLSANKDRISRYIEELLQEAQ